MKFYFYRFEETWCDEQVNSILNGVNDVQHRLENCVKKETSPIGNNHYSNAKIEPIEGRTLFNRIFSQSWFKRLNNLSYS